jgi:hypothetical protein
MADLGQALASIRGKHFRNEWEKFASQKILATDEVFV